MQYSANAQKQVDFENANTIIIKTELTAKEALKDIVDKLKSADFEMALLNEEQYRFVTTYKATRFFDFSVTGHISTKNGTSITIRGIALVDSFTDKYELTAASKKNKRNLKEIAWSELKRIARKYPLGDVYYDKK